MKRYRILARRVSGDLYQVTSPDTVLNAEMSWRQLCKHVEHDKVHTVVVENTGRALDELPVITYHPTWHYPLCGMVRPTTARTAVIKSGLPRA